MKLLFNPKTIEKYCKNIELTIEQKNTAKEWLKLLEENKLEDEKTNYVNFYQTILHDILGYDKNDIIFEKNDVEFQIKNKSGNSVLCIEIKGTKTFNLYDDQHRYKEQHRTPINQTHFYMWKINLDYGLCTNYRKFILLDRNKGTYEFDFKSIETNENKLKEFVGIFSKSRVLSSNLFDDLHKESVAEEREFTKEFYKLFHETRLMLIESFQNKDNVSKNEAINYAQIFLNRLIFMFFVEDRGFVRDNRMFYNRVLKLLDAGQPNEHSKKICEDISELFTIFNEGSASLGVFGFNGGLFGEKIPAKIYFNDIKNKYSYKEIWQHSKLLKSTKLDENAEKIIKKYPTINPIISNLLLMDSFDFTTEISVNILGHIFEQSISDLEELQGKKESKKKKDGVFYTPEYITDYICQNTIIPHLSKSGKITNIHDLVDEYSDDLDTLEQKFHDIKILDPACGSGAFLVKAVDILVDIHKAIQDHKQARGEYLAGDQFQLTKWNEESEIRNIIENNIYGVDINDESVGITRLALFLKLATGNKKLSDLSENIKTGNSLIADHAIDAKSFKWNKEFADILDNGGFDIIIGNPPYLILDSKKLSNYDLVKGNYNTYVAFIECGLRLAKDTGKLSFIVPTTWLSGNNYETLRKKILTEHSVTNIVQLPYNIFEAYIDTIIVGIDKKYHDNNFVKTYKYEIREKAYNNPIMNYVKIKQSTWQHNQNYIIILDLELDGIYQKYIQVDSKKLGDISQINRGTLPPKIGELNNTAKSDNYLEWFDGQVYRYVVKPGTKKFVDHTKLREGKSLELFNSPKIMARQLVSRQFRLQFAWFDKKMAFKKNLYAIYNITGFDPQSLLAILNSKLFSFIHVKANVSVQRDDFPSFSLANFRSFLIPNIDQKSQKELSNLTKIIRIKKSEWQLLINTFHRRMIDNLSINKLGNKLKKFYTLEFKDFVIQVEKKSKKMTLTQQDEWDIYFQTSKQKIIDIDQEIYKLENEIDCQIYKIYDLNQNEIDLIENTL